MSTLEQARRAADMYADALSACANVVGIGVLDEGDGYRVAVYVTEIKPPKELAADDMIPAEVEVGSENDRVSVATRVVPIGQISAEETTFGAE